MRETLKSSRLSVLAAIAAGLFISVGTPSVNAAYPEKPIRLVVPFASGGTTTILARLMAERIGNDLGLPVVVDNRPGAGGNVGMDHVAKSAPDGYTLLMGPIGLAINPALYKNMPFNPINDLAPIGLYGGVPNLLVVNPSVPAKSVAELIKYAKSNPGKLVYASNGNGTSSHLAAEMLKSVANVDMRHVPYKGGGPAMQDLMGGHVDMLFDQMPAVLPQVQAGKVVPLGVSSSKRSETAPAIPAISETLPGFDMVVWFGLLAPSGTPSDVIKKVNASMNKALNDSAFKEKLQSMGVTAMPSSPEEFSRFMKSETQRWGEVVKKSGATIN